MGNNTKGTEVITTPNNTYERGDSLTMRIKNTLIQIAIFTHGNLAHLLPFFFYCPQKLGKCVNPVRAKDEIQARCFLKQFLSFLLSHTTPYPKD